MTFHRAVPLTVLREIPDDPELRVQWNALVSLTHYPQVFYTYEWARAVRMAYGDLLSPLLLLSYDENRQLAGVAALAAPKNSPVSFLCATTGDYCDFVVRPQNAAAFTTQVFEVLRQQGYRDVVLTNFPEDSPCYAALRGAARASGFHMHARVAYVCAQVRLSAMARANGKLALPRQKMVRRSVRIMSEVAPLTIQHEFTWDEVRPQLPEFFRAHVARFLFTDRISNMLRPERRRFLSELARLLSPTGWLCLTRLNVGPRTVSWNYGFTFRGTWFLYQPTFVNDLEKYSPGFVLLCKLIEEAATGPTLEEVDLGLGAESYKESFANASRDTMHISLHRSLSKHWRGVARYRAARAVAARPSNEEALRNFVARAGAFGFRLRQLGVSSALARVLSRMRRWVFSREEVVFFEGGAVTCELSAEFSPRAVTYELLAEAAIESYEDDRALQYLLRSARRMREGKAEGFVLVDLQSRPLHFAWVTAFDGFFLTELNAEVQAPSPESVLLFDCWTPQATRGEAHYGRAARLIADKIRTQGKRPWIFSSAGNAASLREIEKAGFQRRYSLVRQKVFGLQWIKGQPPRSQETHSVEVSA